MTFQKLLSNKEYTVLKRTEEYLYVLISNRKYVFYLKNYELMCFSIDKFKIITIIDFFEEHYSFNRVEIISLENSENSVDLQFKPKELSLILGECFKLSEIKNVKPSQVINEEVLKFLQDFDWIVPLGKWKYSVEEQLFYLIPNNEFCLQFNSNNYEYFGKPSFLLKQGTEEYFCFLNPNTMFDYYRMNLPSKKTNILLGYETIKDQKQTVVIKGTKQELYNSMIICLNTLSIPFELISDKTIIQIHFINHEFSSFFQNYFNLIQIQLLADIDYFKAATSLDFTTKKNIAFTAKKTKTNPYPIVQFSNTITHIQLVIEYILNDLLIDKLSIYNLSYLPINSNPHHLKTNEEFEENPIESFNQLSEL